jgi:hypothetical protein
MIPNPIQKRKSLCVELKLLINGPHTLLNFSCGQGAPTFGMCIYNQTLAFLLCGLSHIFAKNFFFLFFFLETEGQIAKTFSMIEHSEIRIGILLSPFNVTRLVLQESVILSECRILHSMIFWSKMSCYRGFLKKMVSSV